MGKGETEIVTLEQAIAQVRGQPLVSVCFVQDYVQFGFEEADLTANAHPILRIADHDLGWESQFYRHELCLRIGKIVVDTWVREESVSFGFEDGALLMIPIHGVGSVSPESLEFSLNGLGKCWVV